VYEGIEVEKKKRNKASFFDRIKVLLVLGLFFLVLVTYNLNPPFVGWGESFEIAVSGLIGQVLLVLMGIEVARQIHYFISERSAAYNHFWSERFFGGVERTTQRSMSEWTTRSTACLPSRA
jgi:cell division protease FtsH